MRRTIPLLLVGLAAFSTATSSAGSSPDIAWSKIIGADSSALDTAQRNRVASILATADNTRGCQGSIAACLESGDQTARRHAGYVARMVRKGKADDVIRLGIADRAASAFPTETHSIDLSGHPLIGHPSAGVVLVEYSCFQCPFCAHLAPRLEALERKYGNRVGYYYKFFPVRSHPRGVQSALAGLAAHRQGRFWRMAGLMFENRADLEDDDLVAYATRSELDLGKYRNDISDPAAMKLIERDKLEGMRLGVDGTPTFFVNGKLYRGSPDFDELLDRLDEELDIVEGRIR